MKLLKQMAMFAMVAFAAATFTACGGDDDKDEPENPTLSSTESFLIGTWEADYSTSDESYHMTYYKNHTGYYIEKNSDNSVDDGNFKWVLLGKTLTIISEEGYKEVYTIVELSSQLLVLEDDHGYEETYLKIR